MKIVVPALFGFGLLGLVPALAQTVPPTAMQLQQQYNQAVQNQTLTTQQNATQTQLGLIQDQQRRDEAINAAQPPAYQEPILPPQPIYVPPSPPPKP